MKYTLVSGGFDPLHVGHVRYIQEALALDKANGLLVALNDDAWLVRKKGRAFMSAEDRKEILLAITGVQRVEIIDAPDGHVGHVIRRLRPAIFAKGGDRSIDNIPAEEIQACKDVDCKLITGVGGGKVRSSSDFLKAYGTDR